MPERQAHGVRASRPMWEIGFGVLCAEAQADGVPCDELGKSCAQCERATVNRRDPDEGPVISEIAGP